MKKWFLLVLFLLQLLLSAFSPFLEFFDDVYISPGETVTIENLRVEGNDYESGLYIYMDDGSDFYGHQVEAKVKMRTQGGETCDFYSDLFAFDEATHQDTVEDTIYHSANEDWSSWGKINVDLNTYFVKLKVV